MTDGADASLGPASRGAGAASPHDETAELVAELGRRGLRLGIAESLTGGLLAAELIRIPGASAVVNGGIVAYATPLKHQLLGVDAELLAAEGAVHPEVARQMARGARSALAVGGREAEFGIATTGVAGPDPQDGRAPGTVYLGVSGPAGERAVELRLTGDRAAIRAETVRRAVVELRAEL
ncbi:CinA family protein [Agromyces sp. NPDC060279]|uniref:CinA family protein n=1 Tax=Agromyces sp. NPDC060279 TaxID=3347092 RepID=UPI003666863B